MLQVSKSSGLLIVSVAGVVLAVAAAIAAACNSSAPSSTETPVPSPTTTPALYPYTVTGDDDVEVVFDAPPERMVVYDSAAVEMLFAIGEGHRVIATHEFVDYPPETESVARVGDAFNIDLEAVAALEPDLVFMFYDRFNEDLERAGLRTLYLKSLSHGFEQIAGQIRMWGRITGGVEAAEHAAADFEARVAAIRGKLEAVETTRTVYAHGSGYWTPGRETLMNDVFELLKLENIAGFAGYQQISPEVIAAGNPDIVTAGSVEEAAGDPVLVALPAVMESRVFVLGEGRTFSVAGPRFIDAVEELAAWAHPELFP